MIVHVVTDRSRLSDAASDSGWRPCLHRQIACAVEAGVDHVQIRERDLDARVLLAVVTDAVALARGTRTRILVNDRLDVALAAGADGVHLRADSLSVAAARRLAPPGFLIGRSVHHVWELEQAAGADYVVAGTVWATVSKPHDHGLLGIDGLRALAAAAGHTPVLAIGGITLPRLRDVAAAGAAGAAAIGLFLTGDAADCRAGSLVATVAEMRRTFDRAPSSP